MNLVRAFLGILSALKVLVSFDIIFLVICAVIFEYVIRVDTDAG